MKTLNFAKIDKALNVLFSFGAAVVIFGATAKILHWKNADTSIMVGLLTEVLIFTIMGIIEMIKPNVNNQQTREVVKTEAHQGYDPHISFPPVDVTNEMLALKINLVLLNKKIENILKS